MIMQLIKICDGAYRISKESEKKLNDNGIYKPIIKHTYNGYVFSCEYGEYPLDVIDDFDDINEDDFFNLIFSWLEEIKSN